MSAGGGGGALPHRTAAAAAPSSASRETAAAASQRADGGLDPALGVRGRTPGLPEGSQPRGPDPGMCCYTVQPLVELYGGCVVVLQCKGLVVWNRPRPPRPCASAGTRSTTARGRASATAGGRGSVAAPLRTTAHPRPTGAASVSGASLSEATVRPNPVDVITRTSHYGSLPWAVRVVMITRPNPRRRAGQRERRGVPGPGPPRGRLKPPQRFPQ
jgi:hypothetical protein